MREAKYWMFQGTTQSAKVCQQEITELTSLIAGLLAFEKTYLHTHGERTPVFRLLSMCNEAIAANINEIERKFISGDLHESVSEKPDGVPF